MILDLLIDQKNTDQFYLVYMRKFLEIMYQFKSMDFSFLPSNFKKKMILLFSENKMRTLYRIQQTNIHMLYSIGVIRQMNDLDL